MTKVGRWRSGLYGGPDNLPDRVFLTAREVSAVLGVSIKTIDGWCKTRRIVTVKVRSDVYILRESIVRYMKYGEPSG